MVMSGVCSHSLGCLCLNTVFKGASVSPLVVHKILIKCKLNLVQRATASVGPWGRQSCWQRGTNSHTNLSRWHSSHRFIWQISKQCDWQKAPIKFPTVSIVYVRLLLFHNVRITTKIWPTGQCQYEGVVAHPSRANSCNCSRPLGLFKACPPIISLAQLNSSNQVTELLCNILQPLFSRHGRQLQYPPRRFRVEIFLISTQCPDIREL